jgi:hypothetical protein
MSSTRELDHKSKKIKITVSKTGSTFVGTYLIAGMDPPIRGTAADSGSEDGALTNAEHTAKEVLDQALARGPQKPDPDFPG